MRQGFLGILRCLVCGDHLFGLEGEERDEVEIRRARIVCKNCGAHYDVNDGIADFLKNPSSDIEREKRAVDTEEYFLDKNGRKYKVSRDSIERFKDQFLLLPEGDGSHFFKRGGCFSSIAEGAHRFNGTLKLMGLKGSERILNLGDGFGYASYRFAQYGCSVVALDVSSYLLAADVYIKNAYFERIFSDMHGLPFVDDAFDIVFCSAALHHSNDLNKVFSEARRVLKPGGRMFLINESSRGLFERVNPAFEDLHKRGYSDTSYTIPEWMDAARSSGLTGLKMEFLSLADDYIVRQENKDAGFSNFLRMAYFLKRHRGIEKALLFLLRCPRLLFRPKSWRLVCYK